MWYGKVENDTVLLEIKTRITRRIIIKHGARRIRQAQGSRRPTAAQSPHRWQKVEGQQAQSRLSQEPDSLHRTHASQSISLSHFLNFQQLPPPQLTRTNMYMYLYHVFVYASYDDEILHFNWFDFEFWSKRYWSLLSWWDIWAEIRVVLSLCIITTLAVSALGCVVKFCCLLI